MKTVRESEPQAKEKRDQWLPKVRVTASEKREMQEKARKACLPFSEYQRRALQNTTIVIQENPANMNADPELIYQMTSIGNNLNQIAKVLNTLGDAKEERVNDTLSLLNTVLAGMLE